jgi:tubulin polyglutamylase TTLL6/13
MPKRKWKRKGGKTNGGYGSENDCNDDVQSADEYFSKSDGVDSDGEPKEKKITVYIRYTKYSVVKEATKVFMEYHLTRKEKSDWDILWSDGPVGDNYMKSMQYHQRINHIPGIFNIARKNMLARHLMRMENVFKDEYRFYPVSYILPSDFKRMYEDARNSE